MRKTTIIGFASAVLVVILGGLLTAYTDLAHCSEGEREVPCPAAERVSDTFVFAHKPMSANGSITVHVAALTGTLTYPPPGRDAIVPGLVPWAKGGIIIKDGTGQGSPYVALMRTAEHGVRLQYAYTHDLAGSPDATWLRLTREGDTVIGYDSMDGREWTEIGRTRIPDLPATVETGMFATSPGWLGLRTVALGASVAESGFTQASATFDTITTTGTPTAPWTPAIIGDLGHTDWEKHHRAPGMTESAGTVTVTGSGDIGPQGDGGARDIEDTLVALALGLLIVLVMSTRANTAPVTLAAMAFGAGLIAAGATIPLGVRLLRANGNTVNAASVLTELRVIVGVGVLFALAALFARALAVRLHRRRLAILVAVAVVVVPYLLAAFPLLPDVVAGWLLRLTPAAGFAVVGTTPEYSQVAAHYVPSGGYFPLPWWGGLLVLAAWTAIVMVGRVRRVSFSRGSDGRTGQGRSNGSAE
ncbi:hypothetical protein GCM10010435_79050 [Winogradskya consettensis]|uniref:DUF1349 domain-containing protein n=1 Tax=Winogradskya consettensis TaxID=113560 RepID=A0A919SV06_9ACTN|nr:hypothetical protein [Actinoplanes consettensis]GIM77538.1 hypothetical protein Aco04nite_55910 [Actinoplanes consettensis]